MKKYNFAFKGKDYREDCGILLSQSLEKFKNEARLRPQGVVLNLFEEQVENIRTQLQEELGHEVKVFKEKK